jgi:DNA repair protein RadC
MSDKPHYSGHRKRLRERFRETGFSGFQEYEALELLLTYAIPRRDTKPLAKALIAKFGSFQGVLDAPFDELTATDGLSENSATYLTALKECASMYLRTHTKKGPEISATGALLEYCQVAMRGLRDEEFRAIFLNARNEVICDEVISTGTVSQSAVYPRKVMERALHHKSTALIFVHNHPGGICKPSKDDIHITRELVRVAGGLEISVHDHIIICKEGYFSFREQGLM